MTRSDLRPGGWAGKVRVGATIACLIGEGKTNLSRFLAPVFLPRWNTEPLVTRDGHLFIKRPDEKGDILLFA